MSEEKIWQCSGQYRSVEDIIIRNSGMGLRALMNPEAIPPHLIDGIPDAAMLIGKAALDEKKTCFIIGDYDVDGITATAILTKLLRYFNIEPVTIIPKRFTEGYGISENHIADIQGSLIITVDNGISAVEPLRRAKAAGNTVIVLDHHIPGAELPPADVIVDPHLPGDKSPYKDYCGAGLAYKLAEYMCSGQGKSDRLSRLFTDITTLAGIGTVADVMPLTGDNRRIVMNGLHIINKAESFSKLSSGIRAVMNLTDGPFTEETIAFSIAPVLNAPGRLYNAGSTSTLKCLLCTEQQDAMNYVATMREINEKRKALVTSWCAEANAAAQKQLDNPILTLYCVKMPEGIIGIIAGKIAESYCRPCFIFSDTASGLVRASARTYGDFDMSRLLDEIRPLCVTAGGHVGAAGVTIAKENLSRLCQEIQRYGRAHIKPQTEDVLMYDLSISESDIPNALKVQMLYAPYGEGNQKPIFVIRNYCCIEKFNELYRVMGKNQEHIKLHGASCEAVGFNLAEEYRRLGFPKTVDLLGTVGENWYNGKATVQFEILDMKRCG